VLVGATGFEPVTSSVSAKHRKPLCYPPSPQVGSDREAEGKRSLDVKGNALFQPPADGRSPLPHTSSCCYAATGRWTQARQSCRLGVARLPPRDPSPGCRSKRGQLERPTRPRQPRPSRHRPAVAAAIGCLLLCRHLLRKIWPRDAGANSTPGSASHRQFARGPVERLSRAS
jgi:hypothetical protein